MPKVTSYAPSWLLGSSPGSQLFGPPLVTEHSTSYPRSLKQKARRGPHRTIARRGTEVFVASGREIRWGDLVYLRSEWEKSTQRKPHAGVHIKREDSYKVGDEDEEESDEAQQRAKGFRLLRTPAADDIRQLIISPYENMLAVLTTHTVHICLIPESSHLTGTETGPLKPKFWTLGPTTHVTSKSPVVSAIWHPLGVNGTALVTVTEDAVVRVWELSTSDKWSFDSAALAVDLKKLADGTYLDQDFGASTTATNTAFSPDSFDMEVASACFGSRLSGGWSSMTLWVAMRGGDIYALCPLLPQQWSPPPALIPSLSISIVAKVAAIEDDPGVSPKSKLLAQQQLDWMSYLDNQEPKLVETPLGDGELEVYTRPTRPGSVPKLQGPFTLDLDAEDEDDIDMDLTDIYAIGERLNTTDLMMGEEDELDAGEESGGLSLPVICLLSTSGQLKICLDTMGVEAQWLPTRSMGRPSQIRKEVETYTLLAFQTYDLLRPEEVTEDAWPTFSDDVSSRYSFFVTHRSGISRVDLAPWVFRLESELQSENEVGVDLRLNMLLDGQGSIRERSYEQDPQHGALAAAVAIRDPDLGYMVLSATQTHQPIALQFAPPEEPVNMALIPRAQSSPIRDVEPEESQPLVLWQPRPLFQPAEALTRVIPAQQLVDVLEAGKNKTLLQQETRSTPAVLNAAMDVHRLVCAEVSALNEAVSGLFRKCEALQAELREQIGLAGMVKQRVDAITGDNAGDDDDEIVSDNVHVRHRLADAQHRQEALNRRVEELRRKVGRAMSRELSDKERAWMEEVRSVEASLCDGKDDAKQPGTAAPAARAKQPAKRLEEIARLKESLAEEVHRLQQSLPSEDKARTGQDERDRTTSSPAPSAPNLKIPSELRKAKMAQVMGLLEREQTLVDAVKNRLERLSVG